MAFNIALYFSSVVCLLFSRNNVYKYFFFGGFLSKKKKTFVCLNNKISEAKTSASAGSAGVIREKLSFLEMLRETSEKTCKRMISYYVED